jgi:hypothetical protein
MASSCLNGEPFGELDQGHKSASGRDNWLPRNTCLKVSGKKKETWMRWVSELMKQNTRVRDEEKIRKYFFPHDADAIAAINLTQRHTEDFVAWIMEENGIFTVRSAYRLGMQPSLDSMAPGQTSSAPLGDRQIWDCIWKAKVPQKVHIFWMESGNKHACCLRKLAPTYKEV